MWAWPNELENLDQAIFLTIRATQQSPHWLIVAAQQLAEVPVIIGAICLLILLIRFRALKIAAIIILALLMASCLKEAISLWAFHPRPFAAGFGPAFLSHSASSSMPSTHVTSSLVLMLSALLAGWHRTAWLLAGIALVTAWARVYVGVHWPLDMLGAVVSATLCTSLAWCVITVAVQALSLSHHRITWLHPKQSITDTHKQA